MHGVQSHAQVTEAHVVGTHGPHPSGLEVHTAGGEAALWEGCGVGHGVVFVLNFQNWKRKKIIRIKSLT